MSEPIKLPIPPGEAIILDFIQGRVYVGPVSPSTPGTAGGQPR